MKILGISGHEIALLQGSTIEESISFLKTLEKKMEQQKMQE